MQEGTHHIREQAASFHWKQILEPPEEQPELIATWPVTYEQLSVEQQRAALFTDGRSRVNDQ